MALRQDLYEELKEVTADTFESLFEAVLHSVKGSDEGKAVIEALISLLRDENAEVYASAALLLYKLDSEKSPLLSYKQTIEAVDACLEILRGDNPTARINAAQLIGLIRGFENSALHLYHKLLC